MISNVPMINLAAEGFVRNHFRFWFGAAPQSKMIYSKVNVGPSSFPTI
jgi:hypothetical protein